MQPWEPPAESEEGRGYRLNQSQTSDAAQTANSFFRNITNGCSVFVDEQMTLTELKRKLTTQNCPICGKSLKRDLWSHILGHTAERPFSCSVCNKGFTRKSSLTLHKSLHLTQKPFSCTVCGKGFTQKSHLKLHLDIHDKHEQKQKETVISKRTRKTKQAAAVQPKPRLNTEKREQNLGRDQSSPSPTGREKKRRKCRQASDQTRASKRLSPLSISQKGEECPVCGKVFNDLWKHMLLHTGERPFRCSVCRKGFTRVSTLTLHRRLHMKVKPYKCSICEREFTQNCSLKVHLAKHAKEDELVRLRAKPLAQQLRSLNLQKYFGTENDRNFEPQPSTSQ
ncbi:hypothetical protein NQD34_002932 [Periophthalmus magnuspinnatus]|nr:hypothetical protein NQD34_002932 [Periophthalmus magnuspinnatus]